MKKKKKKPKNSSGHQARTCGTRALPGPQPCCCLSADWRCHRAGDGLCCAVTPGRPGVSGRLVHALHSAGASVDTGLTAHGADGLRSLARHLGIPTSTCGALSSLGWGWGCFSWSPEFLLGDHLRWQLVSYGRNLACQPLSHLILE